MTYDNNIIIVASKNFDVANSVVTERMECDFKESTEINYVYYEPTSDEFYDFLFNL